jgi:hypothetical protein
VTTLVIIAVVVVAALFAFGLFLLRGSRGEPVAAAVQKAAESLAAAPPIGPEGRLRTAEEPTATAKEEAPRLVQTVREDVAPEAEIVPASSPAPEIRWSKRFDPASGMLDEESRLKLIRELAFVRGAWCIPLLAQAYEEETGVEHRRAVLTALAEYRHPDARATFESALDSGDDEERSIAKRALSELPPV